METGLRGERLVAIDGTGPDNVVAVGGGSTILHWDGDEWSPYSIAEDVGFLAVHVAAEDEMYAVASAMPRGPPGHIFRYDGSDWSVEESDPGIRFPGDIVRAPGGDLLFAAGFEIWRRGHEGWRAMDIEPREVLSRLWISDDDNVFAFGGEMAGFIYRYDGDTWSEEETHAGRPVNAVWGDSDRAFAVGNEGVILEWDDGSWQPYDRDEIEKLDLPSDTHLYDLWGIGPNRVFAVGVVRHQRASVAGVTLHYDGEGWSRVNSGTDRALYSVWGRSHDEVYAVGEDGVLLRWDGASWSTRKTPTEAPLREIWGVGPDTLFAIGAEGTILRQHKR